MRIEELFQIEHDDYVVNSMSIESFVVESSGMQFVNDCYQQILSNDTISEFIYNGDIIVQVFDSAGNEILSGSDVICNVDKANKIITIKCLERPSLNLIVKVIGMKDAEKDSHHTEKLFQKFFITDEDMVEDEDGLGWSYTIEQSDFEKINLSLGDITVQLFNSLGIEITSSPLFSISIDSNSITVHNIAEKPSDVVYVVIVSAER